MLHDILAIPAILTDDEIANKEEIKVMQACNNAVDRLIVPGLEKNLRGEEDSSIVLLDDLFDEIEYYGVDPYNYIHFVAEEINWLCLGKR